MNARHRIALSISLVVLLALGACGTQSTTPPSAPGAATTAVATLEPTATPFLVLTPTPIATTAPTPASISTPVSLSLIPQPTQILLGGRAQGSGPWSGAEYGGFPTDYGIYSIDTDGTNLHRLDPVGVMDYYPNWSPDGQHITFTRATPGAAGIGWTAATIMVMNADGSNERELTDPLGFSFGSEWSPNGQQILFERKATPGADPESYGIAVSVVNANGTNLHDIGYAGFFPTTPSWSPDGSQVVFTQSAEDTTAGESLNNSIVIVGADGSDAHTIYESNRVIDPVWSPDGTAISFTRATTSPQELQFTYSIWSITIDGTNPRNLTKDKFISASHPTWSPDGTKIAFERHSWSEGLPATNVALVSVMNSDGSDFHDLGFVGDLNCALSWSPDSRAIAFLVTPAKPDTSEIYLEDAELHLAAADGSEQVTILSHFFVSQGDTELDWRPEGP